MYTLEEELIDKLDNTVEELERREAAVPVDDTATNEAAASGEESGVPEDESTSPPSAAAQARDSRAMQRSLAAEVREAPLFQQIQGRLAGVDMAPAERPRRRSRELDALLGRERDV